MSFLDFLILIPEMFLINFTIILLWAGVYGRYKVNNNGQQLYLSFNLYSNFLILLSVFLLLNSSFDVATCLLNTYIIDNYTTGLKIFTLLASFFLLMSTMSSERPLSLSFTDIEINTLRLLVISSLLLLIGFNDFIYLFFALEVYSLASYILIGYRGKISIFSVESSLKYFILGTVFSIIMVYSIALIYWTTGLTNFSVLDLYLNFSGNSAYKLLDFDLMVVASILLLISLFFKLGAAPFHFWAPEVYEGAPTIITYFLFVVPKIAILAIFIKLEFLFYATNTLWVVVVAAIFSMFIGALGGLFQSKLKRLLTYSMINNNGFFLFALSLLNSFSLIFIIFFLIVYVITLIGLFTSIINTRLQQSYIGLKNIWSWTSLFFINKTQSITTSLLLFSSAGIPPLVGFISKFLILLSLVLNSTSAYYLIIIALLVAPLSCFYYIRVVKTMGFTKKTNWLFIKPVSSISSYIISLSLISVFLLLLSSGLWINLIILAVI